MLQRALPFVVLGCLVSFSTSAFADDAVAASPAPEASASPALQSTASSAPTDVPVPAPLPSVVVPPAAPPPVHVVASPDTSPASSADAHEEEDDFRLKTKPGERYGHETALVDVVGIGVTVGAIKGGAPLAIVGLATYVLGGPIVHLAHGHAGKFGLDLGIRLGAPIVGMGLGMATVCAGGGCKGGLTGTYTALAGGFIGVATGVLTAIIVDAAAIAREPGAPPSEAPRWNGKPTVQPQVAAYPGGGSVGVGGAF